MTFQQVMIVFSVIMAACSIFTLLWLYKLKRAEKNQHFDKISARIAKEQAGWRGKIDSFKHVLAGESWRDSTGKEDFVAAVYGGNIPAYLWYALGGQKPSDEDIESLCKLFWDKNPGFGDLEFHTSHHPEVGTALRIRNPKLFTAEIVLGEKVCPLYQTGHSSFGASQAGCVNFLNLYPNKKVVA